MAAVREGWVNWTAAPQGCEARRPIPLLVWHALEAGLSGMRGAAQHGTAGECALCTFCGGGSPFAVPAESLEMPKGNRRSPVAPEM